MRDFFAKSFRGLVALMLVCALNHNALAAPPNPPPEDPNADPVEKAIQKGIQYLLKAQKGDNWEVSANKANDDGPDVSGGQWGGLTSIATYGLLAAGVSPQSAEMSRALAWLDKAQVSGTYAMGMKLQSWNYIERPTPGQKQVLRRDAELLLRGVKTTTGPSRGLYHYWTDPAKGDFDLSCSNYGVLGMWAAAQQNLEVPLDYWRIVDAAWRGQQQKDGGFAYHSGANAMDATMPITAAGVATLFITQDMLSGTRIECKGNIEDKDIDRGLKWLSDHYGTFLGGDLNLYAMYNIERVGTASGYKYFGTTDWYKQGAELLLKTQKPDGSWEGGHGGPVPGTVWGLLFLVKGRAPVMMNKLQYAIELHGDKGHTNWNQRPRDIANLAHWAGKELEKDLNWQIVNLKVDIEDLHDAPILYMAGNQLINLTKEEKEKLKQYVEEGGMILGHADCSDGKFSNSFAKLGQELFPYEFRELPKDHLIYSAQFNGNTWPSKPNLRGLSNGARELMVLIPAGDPAGFWQIKNFATRRTRPLAELAANIFLYSMDGSTLKGKFKGQSYIVKRDDKVPAGRAVKVARLQYGGNWNPEPGGWVRLANLMHNTRGIELDVQNIKLGEGKLKNDFQVAHLTGTVRFRLTPTQIAELKSFVTGGGTLIVDAAGGSAEFKDSVEPLLNNFGKPALLNVDSPVYSATGEKLGKASYRKFAQHLLVSGMNAPRLRGIEVNKRTAILYSPEDLSVGIVGMTVDGIYGYDPVYATKLMESILTYASGGVPKPATKPTAVAAEKPKPDAVKPK